MHRTHGTVSSRTSSICSTGQTDVTFEGVDYRHLPEPRVPQHRHPSARITAWLFQGRYRLSSRWSVYGNYTVQLKNDGNFEGEAANQPGLELGFRRLPGGVARGAAISPLAGSPASSVTSCGSGPLTWSASAGWGTWTSGWSYRYDSPLSFSYVATGVPLTDIQEAALDGLCQHAVDRRTLFFGGRGGQLFPNGSHLFDLAATYSLPILRSLRPYVKLDMRNVFNRTPLISYDTTVDPDFDGPLDSLGLPTEFVRGPNFGQATGTDDYPLPREFRVSVGFRF